MVVMAGFMFILGIFLIAVCAAALPLPLLVYRNVNRCPFYLYLSALLFCYLTEFVELIYIARFRLTPDISDIDNINLINFPVLRIVTTVLFLSLDLLILFRVMDLTFKWRYLSIFLPLIVFCTYIAMQKQTMLTIWAFYLPRQIYRFAFCIFFFIRLYIGKQKNTAKKLSGFSYIMLAVFLLNFSIFLEDTLLIFHIESFLTDMLSVTERNFSESALWFFICVTVIMHCIQQLNLPAAQKAETVLPEKTPDFSDAPELRVHDVLPQFAEQYRLTPREYEILTLMLRYKNSAAISEELCISIGTVKTHTHNLYAKLNVSSKQELMQELSAFFKNQGGERL